MTKPLSIWHYWWTLFRANPYIYLGGLGTRILVSMMLAQLRTLDDERQAAVLRERFFIVMLFSFCKNTRALGTGDDILLVEASAMPDDTFTVGDFLLFVFYTVTDLAYDYPGSENGIQDISFTLDRGLLTVITGRIGSGKSTLLRVMLGLLPGDSGESIWNGHSINDLTARFVPPLVAYTPQVPILLKNRTTLIIAHRLATVERADDIMILDKGVVVERGQRTMLLANPASHFAKVMAVGMETVMA